MTCINYYPFSISDRSKIQAGGYLENTGITMSIEQKVISTQNLHNSCRFGNIIWLPWWPTWNSSYCFFWN